MKTLVAATFLAAASLITLAFAADPAVGPDPMMTAEPRVEEAVPGAVVADMGPDAAGLTAGHDARSVASDAEVAVARRAYNAQCRRVESQAFCNCVTAGVAQALPPADVRLAARTVRERITAEGDAPAPENEAQARISNVETHYADICASYRKP